MPQGLVNMGQHHEVAADHITVMPNLIALITLHRLLMAKHSFPKHSAIDLRSTLSCQNKTACRARGIHPKSLGYPGLLRAAGQSLR